MKYNTSFRQPNMISSMTSLVYRNFLIAGSRGVLVWWQFITFMGN